MGPLLLGNDDVAVHGGDGEGDDVDEVVRFPLLLTLPVLRRPHDVGDVPGGQIVDERHELADDDVLHELVVGHPDAVEGFDDGGADVAEVGAADGLVDGVAGQAVLGDRRREEVFEVDELMAVVGGCMVEPDGAEDVRAGAEEFFFDEFGDRVLQLGAQAGGSRCAPSGSALRSNSGQSIRPSLMWRIPTPKTCC